MLLLGSEIKKWRTYTTIKAQTAFVVVLHVRQVKHKLSCLWFSLTILIVSWITFDEQDELVMLMPNINCYLFDLFDIIVDFFMFTGWDTNETGV